MSGAGRCGWLSVPCVTTREKVKGKSPQGKTDFGTHLRNAGRGGREGSAAGSGALLRAERAGSGRDRAMFTACTPL